MKALMLTVSNLKKGLFPPISVLLLVFGFTFVNVLSGQQDKDQFVVVLDAGHGGHDPGNLGNGYLEKNIALNIVLNAGALLERTPGIKVIYTRKDDTFIDLYVRGEIANKANADLFVSVHCDSHTSQAHGAGTFVLGLHANKQNFEIAKKENSVIYLEDNYESRYADYDINSPESVIGLTIMQEEFLDQSISLAKSIQHNFANKLKRKDRQVKQAGFIVLHQTFMPSVLVETGFLTNDDEGAYLNSKKGQTDMGTSIAEAIINYKEGIQPNYSGLSNTTKMAMPNQNEIVVEKDKTPLDKKTVDEKTVLNAKDAAEQFAKNPSANPIVEKKPERTSKEEGIGKSVQEMKDSSDEVTLNRVDVAQEALAKKSDKVLSEKEDPVKRELTSVSQAPKKAQVAKNEIPKTKVESASDAVKKEKEVTSAPIKGNTKNITFKVQLMASTKKIALQSSNFKGLNKLSEERFKQFHRYMYGSTDSYSQAKLLKSNADAKGYPASYIVAYKDGVRIPTVDAIKLVSQ